MRFMRKRKARDNNHTSPSGTRPLEQKIALITIKAIRTDPSNSKAGLGEIFTFLKHKGSTES